MKNFLPSRIFLSLFLLIVVFSVSVAQAQRQEPSGTAPKKQKTDNRSDSQKSYVNPRTRDVNRNSGGNNQVVRPADRKTGKEVTTEKKTPVNK